MRPQKEISIGEAVFVIEMGKLLIFAPYTAPALAAVTVIGSAVVVMALPIIRLLEV